VFLSVLAITDHPRRFLAGKGLSFYYFSLISQKSSSRISKEKGYKDVKQKPPYKYKCQGLIGLKKPPIEISDEDLHLLFLPLPLLLLDGKKRTSLVSPEKETKNCKKTIKPTATTDVCLYASFFLFSRYIY